MQNYTSYFFLFLLFFPKTILTDLDNTFGTGGIVTTSLGLFDAINGIQEQADNNIITDGSTFISSKTQLGLARYTSTGSLDVTFDSDGTKNVLIGTLSQGSALALQSDNKIVVAGTVYDSQSKFALFRFNTNGSLDTGFNSIGYITTSIGTGAAGNSVAIQADGAIVVGGVAVSGMPQFTLARYTTLGVLDTTFSPSGTVLTPIGFQSGINGIALQSDGKIVATGYVFDGALLRIVVARYNTDGSIDTDFGSSGIVATTVGTEGRGYDVAIQTDGDIVVAGYTIEAGIKKFVVVRYDTNGDLDTTFNSTGIVTTQINQAAQAYAIAIQTDQKIIVGGYSVGNTATEFALTRYTTAGALDSTFDSDGIQTTIIGSEAQINSLAIQSDNKILAAGGSDNNFAVARYNA